MQPILSTTLKSPGKINLHLSVGDKRKDGFHELNSIITAVDFADSLNFSFLNGNNSQTAVTVKEEGPLRDLSEKGQYFPPIHSEKNIVSLAVELFRNKTSLKTDLSIEIIKRIPPGSGMGGGSSNAAAAFLALNKFLDPKKRLSGNEILDMGAQLGSDVPFFIEIALNNPKNSPTRSVNGRGEIFHYVPPPPPLGILLVFPGFSSHTRNAYNLLDEKRSSISRETGTFLDLTDFSWNSPGNWRFTNDFQELFINNGTEKEKNDYQAMLGDLKKAGAAFAGMSGSGSACFGIFTGYGEAENAKKQLQGSFYVLQSTFFLRIH